MLIIANRLSQLDFDGLLYVYAQTIAREMKQCDPELSKNEAYLNCREDLYDYLKNDFFKNQDSFYAMWTVQERYVAALRMEPYKDGLILQSLETAQQERRKGYAKELLLAVCEYLKNTKWEKVYSHIHKKNIASVAVHITCGFEQIADHAVFVDGSVSNDSHTFCLYIKK